MYYVYAAFSYDCLIANFLCTVEKSMKFSVPVYYDNGWNYENGNTVNNAIELLNIGCDETGFEYGCAEITAVCRDCYVRNSMTLTNVSLEMDLLNIIKATGVVSGSTYFSIDDIDIDVSGTADGSWTVEIPMPNPYYVEISLGFIHFDLGAFIEGEFNFGFKFDGYITTDVHMFKQYDYDVRIQYPYVSECWDYNISEVKSELNTEVTADADLVVTTGLKVIAGIGLGFLGRNRSSTWLLRNILRLSLVICFLVLLLLTHSLRSTRLTVLFVEFVLVTGIQRMWLVQMNCFIICVFTGLSYSLVLQPVPVNLHVLWFLMLSRLLSFAWNNFFFVLLMLISPLYPLTVEQQAVLHSRMLPR